MPSRTASKAGGRRIQTQEPVKDISPSNGNKTSVNVCSSLPEAYFSTHRESDRKGATRKATLEAWLGAPTS